MDIEPAQLTGPVVGWVRVCQGADREAFRGVGLVVAQVV